LFTGGASGGSASVLAGYSASNSWSFGMHTDGAEAFKVCRGNTFASNNFFSISTIGVITFDGAYAFPTLDGRAGQSLGTNSAGQLSFQSRGVSWGLQGSSVTMSINFGYVCTTGGALALLLPAVSQVGDMISVVLDGSTSWQITQPNAASRIRIGNAQTTLGTGGTLSSTAQGDAVTLVCDGANSTWVVVSFIGTITPA
jgi:hypothetical protein